MRPRLTQPALNPLNEEDVRAGHAARSPSPSGEGWGEGLCHSDWTPSIAKAPPTHRSGWTRYDAFVFEQMNTEPSLPLLERWFAPMRGGESYLVARWIWLRALGGIFFSAFLALWFQIDGLIGPRGISPAGEYLDAARRAFPGIKAFWFAPTLLWMNSGSGMLRAIVVIGLLGSVLLIVNP